MTKILVTDPCYLISDDDWDICIKIADKLSKGDTEKWCDIFDKQVEFFLKDISGDTKAVVGRTGFGDWVNEIDGKSFTADSGMVCVVAYTRKMERYRYSRKISYNPLCVAELEFDKKPKYELDFCNPNWTQVVIYDRKRTIRSTSGM